MTSWLAEHWLASALTGLYTAALVVNAHTGLRASRSISGYYVGDRNMSGPLIGLSFFATFASTNSYIGHAGKGYEYGLAWMIMPVMLILFTFLSWRWIGPRTRALARNFDSQFTIGALNNRFVGAGIRCNFAAIHPDSHWVLSTCSACNATVTPRALFVATAVVCISSSAGPAA